MQSVISRNHAALVKDEKRYQAAQAAATRIQRVWRGHRVRKEVSREQNRLRKEVIPRVTLDNAQRIKNIERQLERLLAAFEASALKA